MPYEQFEHTADVGIRAWGPNIEEAFSEAGKGLYSIMTDLDKVDCILEEEIAIKEDNLETLLVKFLSELVYLFEVKSYLFCDFDVSIKENDELELKVMAKGEEMDLKKHDMDTAVKGVSYHEINIDPSGEVKVLFDI
ncbi:MAG: archease [Thermoplasmatota archaeon]